MIAEIKNEFAFSGDKSFLFLDNRENLVKGIKAECKVMAKWVIVVNL